jgi:mono/diheme cytochrome c family protein
MRRTIAGGLFAAAVAGCLLVASAVRADEVPEANPMSGDEKAISEGRSWYRNTCSLCHGGKADGIGERSSSARTPADLRKFSKGFRKFVATVKSGVQAPGREIKDMPAWDGVLDDKTIYQIGAYLETLAIEGANWKEGAPR